ncbi:MAG: hypothetical protein GY941_08340 [Planctomycetes bacterium]|nr:hypothetical protein [Planctomycetota bacterium]
MRNTGAGLGVEQAKTDRYTFFNPLKFSFFAAVEGADKRTKKKIKKVEKKLDKEKIKLEEMVHKGEKEKRLKKEEDKIKKLQDEKKSLEALEGKGKKEIKLEDEKMKAEAKIKKEKAKLEKMVEKGKKEKKIDKEKRKVTGLEKKIERLGKVIDKKTEDFGKVMASRFQLGKDNLKDFKDSDVKLPWSSSSCGCVPELDYIIYGFYPYWTKKKKKVPDFSMFTRIGFFSLTPDKMGDFPDLLQWDKTVAKRVAQRHETKVDLVVSYYDWNDDSKLNLEEDYVLINLVDNIVRLIQKYDGDGVAIDFAGIPVKLKTRFYYFIYLLHKELKIVNENYFLNIVVPYVANEASVLNKDNIEGLEKYINLILFMEGKGRNDASNIDKFLSIETRHEIIQKIIPVINFNDINKEFKQQYNDVVQRGFKGVGLWAIGLKGDTGYVKDNFKPDEQEMDTVKRFITNTFPGLCRFVCPDKKIFRNTLFVCAGLFLCCVLLSCANCEIRMILSGYFYSILLVLVLLFLLFETWFLCAPIGRGYRTDSTAAVFCIVVVFFIWRHLAKKARGRFP